MKHGELIERISRLEQQHTELRKANRRLRLATGALLAFAGAGVLMAQTPGAAQNRSLEAEQFVLLDSQGSVRGAKGIGENGTVGINQRDNQDHYRSFAGRIARRGSLRPERPRARDAGAGADRNARPRTVRRKRQVTNRARCSRRANSRTSLLSPGRQAVLGRALRAAWGLAARLRRSTPQWDAQL